MTQPVPETSPGRGRPPASRFKVSMALRPGPALSGGPEVIMAGDRYAVLVEVNLNGPWTRRRVVDELFPAFYGTWQQRSDQAVEVRQRPALPIGEKYYRVLLTQSEIADLVGSDVRENTPPLIHYAWADYVLDAHVDRSVATVKVDAASRVFAASGAGITWAVLDSGIHSQHPHFTTYGNFSETKQLCVDFSYLADPEHQPDEHQLAEGGSLSDENGHGTHVAGIIAGGLPPDGPVCLLQTRADSSGMPVTTLRQGAGRPSGMAPKASLVSIKVLLADGDELHTSSSALIEAMRYIRQDLNSNGDLIRVHGVNMSLGCRWDPADYAAGQSPVCQAVDRLVDSGVVVVVSAGNEGYDGQLLDDRRGHGQLSSITDPGNAGGAITVGATHRDHPHTYGVWFQSSKGPTWDGRLKPDLVAPGEAICSAAAPAMAVRAAASGLLGAAATDPGAAVYAEDSGTSMAAPHVSGAIAAFLSVRDEFVGKPTEVKDRFCAAASDLGRDRFYQGHGMLDLMRVFDNL